MTEKIETVCVYCGASSNVDTKYTDAMTELAHKLAKDNKTVVYGGGSAGTMGVLAREAIYAGGKVIGIIPEHIINTEGQEQEITELHVVDSMHTRKMMMVDKSDAFVAMPGGLGTLDELCEILTWKYLHLHEKPVILGNMHGYWEPYLDMLKNMVEVGYSPKAHLDMFEVANTPDEVIGLLNKLHAEDDVQPKLEQM